MSVKPDSQFDTLFKAVLSLQTVEECYAFFDDLCTITEVTDMKDRLEVARRLIAKETYEHIEHQTKMSSATISRINRCIQYGPGGYKMVLDRLK